MDFLDNIIDLIELSIDKGADNTITTGNIIATGFDDDIDRSRAIVEKAHQWIVAYKNELIDELGITNLKIKFTNNSGYFIEMPHSQAGKVPDYFIQRQTLMQSARYTTEKLQGFEKQLQEASTTLFEKEYDCFLDIRNNIITHFDHLYLLSRNIAKIDFYTNGAQCIIKKHQIIPELSENGILDIKEGKHPVISQEVSDFITNDLLLNKKDFIHVITGPNMGGKSTYLRQNALLIILAHMGYPIPASSAKIPITDKVFSRVGSGDNLFLGQSTFMVEMQEIAYILHNSTKRSFIIIDEIGRGTSTYDGMSLAWSILKYNHDKIKAKTLFATHYHEIIDHTSDLPGASNYSVAVGENNENIVFLRKVIPGGIKKSYGIEVAKLAGIPPDVLSDAKRTMINLKNNAGFEQLTLKSGLEYQEDKKGENKKDTIHSFIEKIDINSLSPLQALIQIEQLQQQVKKSK